MRHTRFLSILLSSATCASLHASDDYIFSYSTEPYVPLIDPTVVVSDQGFNGDFYSMPIGFNFRYWDEENTILGFSTHGYCWLGQTATYGFFPFYLGLVGIGDSQVGYVQDLSGGAGNGILKVEWKHVGFYSFPNGEDHVSFQAWLYEGTNVVELHYGPSAIAADHFVGLFGNPDGPTVQFIHPQTDGSYDLEGSADSPVAVYLSSDPLILQGFPAEGQVYRFTPTASIGVAEMARTTTALVLYPQPAADALHAAYGDGTAPLVPYVIRNAAGSVVQQGRSMAGGIDVRSLANGTYLLCTNEKGRVQRQRFVRMAPQP